MVTSECGAERREQRVSQVRLSGSGLSLGVRGSQLAEAVVTVAVTAVGTSERLKLGFLLLGGQSCAGHLPHFIMEGWEELFRTVVSIILLSACRLCSSSPTTELDFLIIGITSLHATHKSKNSALTTADFLQPAAHTEGFQFPHREGCDICHASFFFQPLTF